MDVVSRDARDHNIEKIIIGPESMGKKIQGAKLQNWAIIF